jgi:hypothetical protein
LHIEQYSVILRAWYTFNVNQLFVVFSALDVHWRNGEGVHCSYFADSDKRAVEILYSDGSSDTFCIEVKLLLRTTKALVKFLLKNAFVEFLKKVWSFHKLYVRYLDKLS